MLAEGGIRSEAANPVGETHASFAFFGTFFAESGTTLHLVALVALFKLF